MLQRLLTTIALLGFGAAACAGVSTTSGAAPPAAPDTPVLPTEFVPTVVTSTPTFEGCAYVWASQELPSLSRRLNAELQKISSDVSGLAYAYGENCVYGDGHQTFSAMETDFRIGVKVKDASDEDALGDWIAKVMPIILSLPPEEIVGPQAGRADFDFKQPDPAERFITVPIERYRREAGDLKGEELFRLFFNSP